MEYEKYESQNAAVVVHIEGDDHPETMSREEWKCFHELARRQGIRYTRIQ